MFSWYFTWRRVRRLKKQKDIAHKMKLNTQRLKAECSLEIKSTYMNLIKALKETIEKIKVKGRKLDSIDSDFNQKEIEKIKSKYFQFYRILFLFVLAETGLYYLTAQLFVPIGLEYIKVSLALTLAVIVMLLLNWSLAQHFEYRKLLDEKEELGLKEGELKNARDRRNGAYVLIFICFIIILAAGLVRIYYLEQMDLTGYTLEEIDNLQKVGLWASVLVLAITFGLGIFLAFLKGEHAVNRIRYKEWKKWRETVTKLNQHNKDEKGLIEEIQSLYKQTIEIYWQLVKELERIWKIEYDEQDKDLFMEFKNLKRSGNLKVDDSTYTKYEDIIYADRDLFVFGCEKDSNVKELIDQVKQYVNTAFREGKNV